MKPLIRIKNLHKSFKVGKQTVPVLRGIDLEVYPQDLMFIFGPSGCGKSTLLHTILGLEPITSGEVYVFGKPVSSLSPDQKADLRKEKVGMTYQLVNWIPSLTVVENVAFPAILKGTEEEEALQEAEMLLSQMEMRKWAHYLPTELSAGQQQKVSLCRALITDPEIIIADEPTGNLDTESSDELYQLLKTLNERQEKTVLIVTHDLRYLRLAKRVGHMVDGKIVEEYEEREIPELLGRIRDKRG